MCQIIQLWHIETISRWEFEIKKTPKKKKKLVHGFGTGMFVWNPGLVNWYPWHGNMGILALHSPYCNTGTVHCVLEWHTCTYARALLKYRYATGIGFGIGALRFNVNTVFTGARFRIAGSHFIYCESKQDQTETNIYFLSRSRYTCTLH